MKRKLMTVAILTFVLLLTMVSCDLTTPYCLIDAILCFPTALTSPLRTQRWYTLFQRDRKSTRLNSSH